MARLKGPNQDSTGTSQALGKQAWIGGSSLVVTRPALCPVNWVPWMEDHPGDRDVRPRQSLGYKPGDLASESELALNPNCLLFK